MSDQRVAQFLAKKHLVLWVCFNLLGNGQVNKISLDAIVITIETLSSEISRSDIIGTISDNVDLDLENNWVTLS